MPAATLQAHGAVSEETARAMADGALVHSHADVAVSVTGVAGPDGGSAEKPVGLVWFGIAQRGGAACGDRQVFPGNRAEVRLASVRHALKLLSDAL